MVYRSRECTCLVARLRTQPLLLSSRRLQRECWYEDCMVYITTRLRVRCYKQWSYDTVSKTMSEVEREIASMGTLMPGRMALEELGQSCDE